MCQSQARSFDLDSNFTFREKFVAVCDDLAALGLKEHQRRCAESDDFFACIEEAKDQNKEQGVKLIDKFANYKKRVSSNQCTIYYAWYTTIVEF